MLEKPVTLELAAQCLGITVDTLRAALAMEDFMPERGTISMNAALRVFRLYINTPERREAQRRDEADRMRRMHAPR